MKRSTESALPKTTLQWGTGMVVTAVMGFFPSSASYERICFPKDDTAEPRSEEGSWNTRLDPYYILYLTRLVSLRLKALLQDRPGQDGQQYTVPT